MQQAHVEHLVGLLQQCKQKKNLLLANILHSYMCEHHLETNHTLSNRLVPVLVHCGSLADAQHVFDGLASRNEYSWSSLMAGYIDCGELTHAFHIYHQMQEDHIHPSKYTFVALLRGSARLTCGVKGQGLHATVIKGGLETDPFVGNTLVDMYARCAMLAEAHHVLIKLPIRDTVTWNALIAGYAEHGLGEEALSCFEQMQLEGQSPDDITFVCSLKACGSTGAIERTQELCAEIAKLGLERDLFVGNAVVGTYAKCGSLEEAHHMFDKLSVRDVISWNIMIGAYAEHGHGNEALNCYQHMQLEEISPDDVTFVSSLKACCNIGAIEEGQALYMELSKKGLEKEVNVGNTLVDMYVKCGSFLEAHTLADQLSLRNVVPWTALVVGYAESGFGDEALNCFEQMQLFGIPPDATMLVCSLKACGSFGAIERGRLICTDIIYRGLERDLYISSAMVDMYSKCGLIMEAQEVFNWLTVRNVVSWTALITGYAEYGFGKEALKCFKKMQLEGISPVAETYACILKACGIAKALETGQKIHVEIDKRGLEKELYIGNTLVDMYSKCGSCAEARASFEWLPVRNAVAWTALISGYAEEGFDEEVLICFERMRLDGVRADAVTYICCLKACGMVGSLEKGREIHSEIRRLGLDTDLFVGSTLIDMYSKCGFLQEGREVFDKLPARDVVTWNSMIKGYGENHESAMAEQCFKDMQLQGVEPDAVTFTCLLVACSNSSLVSKGQKYFCLMMKEHDIEPKLEHCTCMVDMLARSGYVHEAERFIEAMRCPPCKEILTALLTGCKIYGEVELGQRFFQQLVQINQEDAVTYLLLADIYATAGRWTDANRIEELRKHAGAQKKAASVLTEVNNTLHEFVVGDVKNIGILAMFEKLATHMKSEYVPHLDLVLNLLFDEEGH